MPRRAGVPVAAAGTAGEGGDAVGAGPAPVPAATAGGGRRRGRAAEGGRGRGGGRRGRGRRGAGGRGRGRGRRGTRTRQGGGGGRRRRRPGLRRPGGREPGGGRVEHRGERPAERRAVDQLGQPADRGRGRRQPGRHEAHERRGLCGRADTPGDGAGGEGRCGGARRQLGALIGERGEQRRGRRGGHARLGEGRLRRRRGAGEGDGLGREAQGDTFGAGLVHHEAERLTGLQGQVARRGDQAAREGELDQAGLHRDDTCRECLAGRDREDRARGERDGRRARDGRGGAGRRGAGDRRGDRRRGSGGCGCDGRHPTHRRPRGLRPEAPGDQVASRGCR